MITETKECLSGETIDICNQFNTIRTDSEKLCSSLQIEDFTPQSVSFTSPPKWHLAHTTWFFEEMILKKHVPNYSVFDENYSFLFNSYYNSIGQRIERSERGLITRPDVATVFEYRKYVNNAMNQLLLNSCNEKIEKLVVLGLQHEQQHQELLLTDLKYTFSRNPIHPIYSESPLHENFNKEEGWISVEEGIYEIGHKGDDFCFDNELGKHRVFLENYSISNALVTNMEYIEFIESNGYQTPSFWLDEGWAWVQKEKQEKPLYWHKINEEWYHYTLAGLKKVNPKAILSHVSFYEAAAYASFRNKRLPTEFEWEVASNQFSWGFRWEWTNSAYLPYPKFQIAEGAVGEYNGKFMINQMVLRGASVATSKNHSRNTYRNFFHPKMQWQFSGIRLAK